MRKIAICILASLALAASARADTVYMKDGKVYQGQATREGSKVHVKTTMGGVPVTITVDADDVERIRESAPASRPAAPTSAPAVSLDTGRRLEDAITRPEAMVFLAMQKLAVAPSLAGYEARQAVETFQAKAHDGQRKADGKWYSPKEITRAKERYLEFIKDSRDAMNEVRRAETGSPSARADVPRRRRELAMFYRKAATVWPNDLLGEFLMGAAQIEGGDFIAAQHAFQRCIDAAPRVAAFHQGKAMALAGRNQPVAGIAAAIDAIELQPDSPDALAFLKQSLDATPGNLMSDPTCVLAKAIKDRYETPGRMTSSGYRRGITWLLPGKSVTASEHSLPSLPMDRLEFRQAVGVPVGKHALLADIAALDGALEAFIVIDGKTTVPAQVVRTYSLGSSSKKGLPVALVYVRDVEFTPLTADGKEKPAKDQAVSFYGLSFFEQMGGRIRPVDAIARGADPNGAGAFSAQLLPGEGAGPVISKSGELLGFLAGRTDPTSDGGGPDRFVPAQDLAALIKRAPQSSGTGYGGYSSTKRQTAPKPVAGQYFTVFVTAAEYPRKTTH